MAGYISKMEYENLQVLLLFDKTFLKNIRQEDREPEQTIQQELFIGGVIQLYSYIGHDIEIIIGIQ